MVIIIWYLMHTWRGS